MAGTRTAPDVTGTATAKSLTVHWIDNSGDIKADSYLIEAAATNAEIEAYLDALQAASNASLSYVEVHSLFGTDALADNGNAVVAAEKSTDLFDNLVVTLKHTNPEYNTKRIYIPAPLGAMFINDGATYYSDEIDGTSTELGTVLSAALAMFGTGWAVLWSRYVKHAEQNKRTRI